MTPVPTPPEPDVPEQAALPTGDALRALAQQGMRRSSQSPLYQWLNSIADTLMAEGGRLADWEPLCAAARNAGLVDGKGQLPTPRRMSRLWQKIRQRRAAKQRTAHTSNGGRASIAVSVPGTALAHVHQREQPDQAVAVISPSPLARPVQAYAPLPKPETLTEEQKDERADAEFKRFRDYLKDQDDRKAPIIY